MRFLTDTQTNQRFVELLRKLEFDVRTAYDEDLAGKVEDYRLVRRANEQDRIFITFDGLKAEAGAKVARELRTRGGKVIKMRGGPDQDHYRALGRFLFHYPDWQPFLHTCDGVVVISDVKQSCITYTPTDYHQTYHQTDARQFELYLAKRKAKPYRPRGRRKKITPAIQAPMVMD